MAEFLVKVADERGHLTEQLEHGYSEDEGRERVSQQGYLVYWVKPRGMFSPGKRRGGRIRQSSFLVFNQQFLTLIHAGLPILTALELLLKRQKDASLKAVLDNVRERVKGGELLSDAFAAQNMQGDYQPLAKFLNGLERDKIFFIVNSVGLAEQNGLVLQMKLETYQKVGS